MNLSEATIEAMQQRVAAALHWFRENDHGRSLQGRRGGDIALSSPGDVFNLEQRLPARVSPLKGHSAALKFRRLKNADRWVFKFVHFLPRAGVVILMGGRSLIEVIRLAPATPKNNSESVNSYMEFAKNHKRSVRNLALSVLVFFDHLFIEGHNLSAIGTTKAAVLYFVPEIKPFHDLC